VLNYLGLVSAYILDIVDLDLYTVLSK